MTSTVYFFACFILFLNFMNRLIACFGQMNFPFNVKSINNCIFLRSFAVVKQTPVVDWTSKNNQIGYSFRLNWLRAESNWKCASFQTFGCWHLASGQNCTIKNKVKWFVFLLLACFAPHHLSQGNKSHSKPRFFETQK